MGAAMALQLLIEGEAAGRAAEELTDINGLSVELSHPEEAGPVREPVTLTVIATVAGILSGSATVADLVLKWYRRHKDAPDTPIEKVVLVHGDRRVLLDQVTVGQLADLLQESSRQGNPEAPS
ncbi:hypothetical protein [Streptomyces sp. NPDC053542]|uniref:hypothetical protein n=1 Tax=Streptomyces sp. NPDC053542 TaxID=3365710 RepID=UPI0037D969E0